MYIYRYIYIYINIYIYIYIKTPALNTPFLTKAKKDIVSLNAVGLLTPLMRLASINNNNNRDNHSTKHFSRQSRSLHLLL